MGLNHFDDKGAAIMVDVSAKPSTLRTAVATAEVQMSPATLATVAAGSAAKGDVFGVARLAGIAAAKKTSDLIPLSHPLAVHYAAIEFVSDEETGTVTVTATVRALERTGVEMEAMTAACVAALTIYDMCKGMEKGIVIGAVALLRKEGGKSGTWQRGML